MNESEMSMAALPLPRRCSGRGAAAADIQPQWASLE